MIKLYFTTTVVVSAKYGNVPITMIRLMAKVKFRQRDNAFSESLEAIVDTGAYLSVIPMHIWRNLQVSIDAADVTFGGINPRPECQIPAALGRVKGILVDEEGNFSPDFTFPAFLAKTDQVPIILGFAGLLDRVKVCFDYQREEAYIEEKFTPLTAPHLRSLSPSPRIPRFELR